MIIPRKSHHFPFFMAFAWLLLCRRNDVEGCRRWCRRNVPGLCLSHIPKLGHHSKHPHPHHHHYLPVLPAKRLTNLHLQISPTDLPGKQISSSTFPCVPLLKEREISEFLDDAPQAIHLLENIAESLHRLTHSAETCTVFIHFWQHNFKFCWSWCCFSPWQDTHQFKSVPLVNRWNRKRQFDDGFSPEPRNNVMKYTWFPDVDKRLLRTSTQEHRNRYADADVNCWWPPQTMNKKIVG